MKKLQIFLIASISLTGCQNYNRQFSEINGLTQGSTYHIVFETRQGTDVSGVREGIEAVLASVDNSLSIYNKNSVISLVNSNKSDMTDPLFIDIFRRSEEVWEKSNGAFDITIGPLVRAWGFGPDAMRRFDETRLDSLLALVGMEKVRLDGERVVKEDPDMFIDVNAIAQGYTVDLVVDYLDGKGFDNCLVEVGGEVRARGNKDGYGWRVGIDRPSDGNFSPGADLQAIIKLKNISLATSGNYRKFYVENGVKYSHTINPRTGYPVRHTLLSATILARDCATADAWATACMVVGRDSAIAFLEKYDFIEGYLIYSDESGNMKTWMSGSLKKIIEQN